MVLGRPFQYRVLSMTQVLICHAWPSDTPGGRGERGKERQVIMEHVVWERSASAWQTNLAVGQNQWYHFGVGAPPILVYFSGDWDVHWGYGILTYGHLAWEAPERLLSGLIFLSVKSWGLTSKPQSKPCNLSILEGKGISGGAVKRIEERNNTPKANAQLW